jgi:hypothetical protein
MGLNIRTNFIKKKLSLEAAETYSIIKNSDNTMNTRNINTNFRINYDIGKFIKGLLTPSLAVMGNYSRLTDKLHAEANNNLFTVMIVLTTSLPYSF